MPLVLAMIMAVPAHADAPPAPAPMTICSLSARICATREPARGTVLVSRRSPGGQSRPLWRAPTRGQNLQVADDGRSLVEFYPGSNLLELGAGRGTTVLTFHRPGVPPVRVTLGEVVRNPAGLPRTTSHRQWASTYGYDGRGHYLLETAEGRRFLFNPQTGRPVIR